ncbi:hypothetical protein ABFS83_14G193000 [Erythranthe nasuta]
MSASDEKNNISSIITEDRTLRFSVDLVSAARRNLSFLRLVSDSHWLHHKPTLLESIRRYDKLWMPLIADLTTTSKPPMILPPLDIEWVWYCHTLNPGSYRQYCESKFSKLIGKPAIFDEENEEYALNRCREIWENKFPSEPFENEADINLVYDASVCSEELLDQMRKQRDLHIRFFSEPYYSEMVYLVAAKERYKAFLHMVHKFADQSSFLAPTSDVLLMWITHQSYPTVYATDIKELDGDVEKIIEQKEYIEKTKKLWERTFDQPFEKAGASIAQPISNEPPFYWDVTNADVNTIYKSMVPRFLFEVCISVKVVTSNEKQIKKDLQKDFLRLRMVKGHRELKMEKPVSDFSVESWQKAWHLYSEFGTKGVIIELRQSGGKFSTGSSLRESVSFSWNEILRAPSLTSVKKVDQRSMTITTVASITPPVQGSYLLKCVPDRVTDDSGAMVSDVILRMNQYRPQEGRWLSRTVLDHAGRECFVVRIRVGGGFWRRGGEIPTAVKWENRIIEIREGSWSYVVGSSSIGTSPEKVVGTATPKEPKEGFQALWSFSSGNELLIKWDSSKKSISELRFDLQSEISSEPMVKLLQGRQMQYQVKEDIINNNNNNNGKTEDEEEEFVTLIRYTDENPTGKATALMNWKLMVVEVLAEEDAVEVLLICVCIVRSVSEMKREDVGKLLVRRRIREAKIGDRDWSSVILHPSSYNTSRPSLLSSYISSVQPWYWNAELVTASHVKDQIVGVPSSNYSQAEGGDKLYKAGIIP